MNKKRLIHNLVVASAVGAMTVAPLISPSFINLGKGATVVYADNLENGDFVFDSNSYSEVNGVDIKTQLSIKGNKDSDYIPEIGDTYQITVKIKNTWENFSNRSYFVSVDGFDEYSDSGLKSHYMLSDTYTLNGSPQKLSKSFISDGLNPDLKYDYYTTQQTQLNGLNNYLTYVFDYKIVDNGNLNFDTFYQPFSRSIFYTYFQNPDEKTITADNASDFINGGNSAGALKDNFETITVLNVLEGDRKQEIADRTTIKTRKVTDDGKIAVDIKANEIDGYDFVEVWGKGKTLSTNTHLTGVFDRYDFGILNQTFPETPLILSKMTISFVYKQADDPTPLPVPTPDYGVLTVKYQDKEGNDLDSPTYQNVEVGKEYTATAKEIDGYTLDGEATVTGNMTKDGQTIVFTYKANEVTPTPEEPETPEPEVEEPEVVEPTIPEDLVDENTTTETPDENTLEVQETDESISTTKFILVSILSIFLSGGIIYVLINNDSKRLKGFNRFKK